MHSVGRKEELISWFSLKALFPDNQCNAPFNRSDNLVGVMHVVAGPPATPKFTYAAVETPRIPGFTHLGATHRDTKHSPSYHWFCRSWCTMGDKELDNIEMKRRSRVVDGQGVDIVSRVHISTFGDERFDDRQASTLRRYVQGRFSRHPTEDLITGSRVHICAMLDQDLYHV